MVVVILRTRGNTYCTYYALFQSVSLILLCCTCICKYGTNVHVSIFILIKSIQCCDIYTFSSFVHFGAMHVSTVRLQFVPLFQCVYVWLLLTVAHSYTMSCFLNPAVYVTVDFYKCIR